MCPVNISGSVRINPYFEVTSDMERENLLDNREQEESREAGGEHTLLCGYDGQFDVHLVICPQKPFPNCWNPGG